MTKLSVNINKIATLRNARGGNIPDVTLAALNCEKFGAQGITVHPRPDERHIRYSDVRAIRPLLKTEFNIEGNPTPQSFRDLVLEVVPDQVTLVPDAHDAITSNAGWDTISNREFLSGMCGLFHSKGIRVSIFIDPKPEMAVAAKECGADRVELYTEAYAAGYPSGPGAERRARPQSGQPRIFHPHHSMDRRGIHRARHHMRRTLSRIGKYHKRVLGTHLE